MIDYDKIINGKEEECDNFPLSEFILGWVLFVVGGLVESLSSGFQVGPCSLNSGWVYGGGGC